MGGPTREGYRAYEARRRARLDALRTREGVVDLAEWRAALKVLPALEKVLGGQEWFLGARLVPADDVGFVAVVTALRDGRDVRMCLPSHVDDVPVRVEARNPPVPTAAPRAPAIARPPPPPAPPPAPR